MRDVLLITVDSLRADHVGYHGYDRGTTPTLDELATSGHSFSNAFAHACNTRLSFPALLTSSHALLYGGYERLSEQRTLLSEVFDEAGYQTGGFHSNLYLGADFGYDRGFDAFHDSKTDPSPAARVRQFVTDRLDESGFVYRALGRGIDVAERRVGANVGSPYVDATEITDMAIEWIGTTASDRPSFLWVHYMDVHHPYVPPENHQRAVRDTPIGQRRAIHLRRKMIEEPERIAENELDDIIDLYDAEVRYVDAQIDRLIEAVGSLWDETVVCVTADHGEELLDHGEFGHPPTFYEEVIHVPLLIHDGDRENRTDSDGSSHDDLVGLLDVAPTLLDYADLPQPDRFRGHSLRALVKGDRWNRTEVIGNWSDGSHCRLSYRDTAWKYVRDEESAALYDLIADPRETTNVANEHESVVSRIEARLDEHEREIEATQTELGEVGMDEQVKRRLRELGYRE